MDFGGLAYSENRVRSHVRMRLTLSPETQTPLGCGHSTVSVQVTGVKERSDAHLIFLQVYSGQL